MDLHFLLSNPIVAEVLHDVAVHCINQQTQPEHYATLRSLRDSGVQYELCHVGSFPGLRFEDLCSAADSAVTVIYKARHDARKRLVVGDFSSGGSSHRSNAIGTSSSRSKHAATSGMLQTSS